MKPNEVPWVPPRIVLLKGEGVIGISPLAKEERRTGDESL